MLNAVRTAETDAESEQQNGECVSVWIYSTEEGLRRLLRERERGRKGVRKRLPLRQMCAAKAADVDAYAAGWLTASLRSSKGSEPRFNHFISLFRTTRTRNTGLQCFVPAIIGNLIFFFNLHLFVLAVKEVLCV